METFLEEGYTSVYIMNAYNQRVGLRLTDRMDLESKDGEQRATPPSSSLIDILYIYMYAHTYRMEGWFRATSSVNNFPRIWRDRRKRTEPVRDYYTRCMETKRER